MQIRLARTADLSALVELEHLCFEYDQISRRSFQRFLRQPQDRLLVAEGDTGELSGYGLLLHRRGTVLARIYSLAVSPQARGKGLGKQLLQALESEALTNQCRFVRLEVRDDNAAALALYEAQGYKILHRRTGYYDDGADAFALEKRLQTQIPPHPARPYYAQSTPFTCGPAALMMALNHLDRVQPLTRAQEIQLWREATTVYMTTGLGGTSPLGLALAANRRGFEAKVLASHLEPPFIDSVRVSDKRQLMIDVHNQFLEEARACGIGLHPQVLMANQVTELREAGWQILVLISTWRLNRNKAPHWVWWVGEDEHHAYLNDPDIDEDEDQSAIDNQYMPVPLDAMDAMTRYGKQRFRAAVLVRNRVSKQDT
jgi:ribosomal protein S18 acetylase RimI-like enzyme